MAATTDLINPITWPNGFDTANNNPLTRSDKVIRQGKGENVETALNNVEFAVVGWLFNAAVTDSSDPGATFMALNNADKNLASIATFNIASAINSARFTELLSNMTTGDRISLQERNDPNNVVLYRITGSPTAAAAKIDLTIEAEQNQGDAIFANNSFIIVRFFFTRPFANPGGLPQNQTEWLSQIASQQLSSVAVTNINDTVTDVLIWRRSAIVTNAIISDIGVGLRIDEANRQSDGTFDRPSGTAVFDDDLANAYIYVGITNSDFSALDIANTFLEARRNGELVFSSSLDALTTPTQVSSGQFTYRRTTNNQYHYIAGDVLTVVTRVTSQTTQYNYNTPAGDFTQNIAELPFSAVDADFAGRVNGPSDNPILPAADRVKLTGLLVSTTTTGGQNLTVLYKDGEPSGDVADYDKTWNAANPVLANFGSERIVSILVDNNITVSSVSGGATLGPQLLWIPGKYIYRVTLPAEISTGTPTSHLPVGVIETFLPTGFNENYKIVRANVEANLLAAIDAHGNVADIRTLETKVNNLFPLTPDVAILNDWADIYDPIHGAAVVDIIAGYSRIADYRSDIDRYESTGVVYATGTDVIIYTGLSNNLHRSFGFVIPQISTITLTGTSGTANIPIAGVDYLATFNTDLTTTASDFVTTHATALNTAGITVTANAGVLTFTANEPGTPFTIGNAVNVTGNLGGTSANVGQDKVLMWIVDGANNIPFVDITSGGNIRVNNYTPRQTVDNLVEEQPTFLTRTGGTSIVSTAPGSFARFTIPNFPAGATQRSRRLQIDPDVYLNGVNTQAGRFLSVPIPATNTAEAIDTVSDSIFLGPLFGNRTVNIEIGYEFIVEGANLVVDLTLVTASSGVTVDFEPSTAAFLTYTTQSVVARVDDFESVSGEAGTYAFSGQQEFILSMRPVINGQGDQTGYLEVVPAAVGADGIISGLSDVNIRIPTPIWDEIQVADDIGFKTFEADHYFIHDEIVGMLRHRNEKWAYAKARLQTANPGHSIREPIDLATGSTLNGVPLSTNGSRTWRDSQAFTAAATNLTVNLPAGTTLSTFVFIEITWHTGVGTATDNDNRNYSELGSMQAIIDMTDAELILGGRGRGAENFGIEIDQPTADTDTSLTMSIVNFNDLGGAALPAGSLITAVKFY